MKLLICSCPTSINRTNPFGFGFISRHRENRVLIPIAEMAKMLLGLLPFLPSSHPVEEDVISRCLGDVFVARPSTQELKFLSRHPWERVRRGQGLHASRAGGGCCPQMWSTAGGCRGWGGFYLLLHPGACQAGCHQLGEAPCSRSHGSVRPLVLDHPTSGCICRFLPSGNCAFRACRTR